MIERHNTTESLSSLCKIDLCRLVVTVLTGFFMAWIFVHKYAYCPCPGILVSANLWQTTRPAFKLAAVVILIEITAPLFFLFFFIRVNKSYRCTQITYYMLPA